MTHCHNSRYFPYLFNKEYDMLKIDDIGRFSISCPRDAEFVTNVIINSLARYMNGTTIENSNTTPEIKNGSSDNGSIDARNTFTITDATAGVGGNTISFDRHFNKVQAVESDLTRFQYLVNNMSIYKSKYTEFLHVDYTTVYLDLKQDVVFIDPPWGGPDYKYHDKLRIKLTSIPIERIVKDLLHSRQTKLVTLKLPLNYDYDYFDVCFPSNEKHPNKNMIIVVVFGYF